MIIPQAELDRLTRKRYGTREALSSWFTDVDAILAMDAADSSSTDQ
jgi:hypothetical protein